MKRKILSILLSGLMVLSVAACNTGKTPTDPATDPGNTEPDRHKPSAVHSLVGKQVLPDGPGNAPAGGSEQSEKRSLNFWI